MKKKSLAVILSAAMLAVGVMPVNAAALTLPSVTLPEVSLPQISITIDGDPVEFTESLGLPFIDSSFRTQVPLRAVMEAFGCTVSWDDSTKTASVTKDGITVSVPIGQKYILINGVQQDIDTAALIKDGRTYLPIRAVLEAFGCSVDWDAVNKCVEVTTGLANMVNPWTFDLTEAAAEALSGISFNVPDGAVDISYGVLNTSNMLQVKFTDEAGTEITFRAQPTETFEDISGTYMTWDVERSGDEVDKISGNESVFKICKDDGEGNNVWLYTWYDSVQKVSYSIMASGADLNGFDLLGLAESMYIAG